MIENEPIESLDKFVNSENKINIIGSGGFDLSTAEDCMICGEPFIQDWQHKNYTMCPKCRDAIKKLIGR